MNHRLKTSVIHLSESYHQSLWYVMCDMWYGDDGVPKSWSSPETEYFEALVFLSPLCSGLYDAFVAIKLVEIFPGKEEYGCFGEWTELKRNFWKDSPGEE